MNFKKACPERSRGGFTLAELLMVMSIISILSGIVIVSILGSKSKGRDAKRIGDVASIQLALEIYYDTHSHKYPTATDPNWAAATGVTTLGQSGYDEQSRWDQLGVDLREYLAPLPKDPQNTTGQRYFVYIPVDKKGVIIKTKLEKDPNLMTDDACPSITEYYDIVLGAFGATNNSCLLTPPPNI